MPSAKKKVQLVRPFTIGIIVNYKYNMKENIFIILCIAYKIQSDYIYNLISNQFYVLQRKNDENGILFASSIILQTSESKI